MPHGLTPYRPLAARRRYPPFAGKTRVPAETLMNQPLAQSNLDLPAISAGGRKQMVAVLESGTPRKQKAGQVLLTIGGFSLLLQLWAMA